MKTKTLAALVGAILCGWTLDAQVSNTVFVSGTEGYTDCVSLSRDSKDMDVIVKFSFDEAAGTLNLSLVSYRGLFVFHDASRYSKVFPFGRFKPEKLSYEVASEPGCKYKSTAALRKSLARPVGKYVFKRWIDYEGLQPVPSEYRMVNDRIEQSFIVNPGRAVVSISLHDILLMDPGRKEGRFDFVYDRDLNRRYDIAILRDGCFGKEEEIKSSRESLDAIWAAYDTLKVRFPGGVAQSKEALDIFNQMKGLLLAQFKKKNADSDCGCIADNLEKYNSYVDSISVMTVKVPAAQEKVSSGPQGINSDNMFARARKIDMSISRWRISNDPVERNDIAKNCRAIIAAGHEEIRTKGVYTQTQKNARDAFLEAEAYFNRICK